MLALSTMLALLLVPARAEKNPSDNTDVAQPISTATNDAATGDATDPDALVKKAHDQAEALAERKRETRAEIDRLSNQLSLSKDEVAKLKARIDGLAKDRAALRDELVSAASQQKDLETRLSDDEDRLAALKTEQDGIHANLKAHRGRLAEVLGALERMGQDPPPALLVEPRDALSSVRSAILLGSVVPRMRGRMRALLDELDRLAAVRASIAKQQEGVKATLSQLAEQKTRLSLLIEKKKALQSHNRDRLQTQSEEAKRLADQASSLQDFIGKLDSQMDTAEATMRQARLAQERRRAETEAELQAARRRVENGLPDKNRITPAYAFSSLKHALNLPAAGRIVHGFGDDDGTGHALNGIMVSTQPGAVVTAPADGKIVYAGPFRSYGELVILDVGDGYHLVMAGMEEIDVDEGQFVVAGEPVAQMGQTRLAAASALAVVSGQPTLYIEFRKDGKPVDPSPWWTQTVSGRVKNGT
ncbi:murein hydrolase activator EnvC family protein [Pararhizobium mangrovi]|nr:murein hydrolase activator EnvC [Pararhizobium mangrovi]